jgi:16S rRNA (cytidine1402-2'-O)-methyltransferase
MTASPRGRLVLVPNTLDLGATPEPIDQVLSAHALRRAAGLTHWVVESPKTARAFLKRVDAQVPLGMPLQGQRRSGVCRGLGCVARPGRDRR